MSKSAKAKTVTANIKLLINAGQAKPAPPVGPALGQAGLNIMSFCKDFNAKTADIKVQGCAPGRAGLPVAGASLTSGCLQDSVPVPVKLLAYSDKSFTYVRRQLWQPCSL